jgi:hypothetical protein
MNKDELLDKTAQAWNSFLVMNKLRDCVRNSNVSTEESNIIDNTKVYDNKKINNIYHELLRRSGHGTFWDDISQYSFENQPSVNFIDKYDYTSMADRTSKNKADHYCKISLLDHTYNVVKIFIENEHKEYVQQQGSFLVLLSSVLHDFGKSIKLQSFLYKDDMSKKPIDHSRAGLKYVYHLKEYLYSKYALQIDASMEYRNSIFLFKQIERGVSKHHNVMIEQSIEGVVATLDRKTRALEWDKHISENPNLLEDIIRGEEQ